MELLKKILIGIFGATALFVLWMNLTPGHYQTICGGCLEYSNREKMRFCTLGLCIPRYGFGVQNFMKILSVLDLYK